MSHPYVFKYSYFIVTNRLSRPLDNNINSTMLSICYTFLMVNCYFLYLEILVVTSVEILGGLGQGYILYFCICFCQVPFGGQVSEKQV